MICARRNVAAATLLLTMAVAGTANADLIFSDISYTSSTFTFTVTGDFSAEDQPDPFVHDEFMIRYLGDMWSGAPGGTNSTFSSSPFVANPVNFASTGFGRPLTYSDFDWQFSLPPYGTGTGQSVTIFLGANYLNTAAQNATVRFEWGAYDLGFTVLETVRLSPVVPEPGSLIVLAGGLSIAGIRRLRHRRARCLSHGRTSAV